MQQILAKRALIIEDHKSTFDGLKYISDRVFGPCYLGIVTSREQLAERIKSEAKFQAIIVDPGLGVLQAEDDARLETVRMALKLLDTPGIFVIHTGFADTTDAQKALEEEKQFRAMGAVDYISKSALDSAERMLDAFEAFRTEQFSPKIVLESEVLEFDSFRGLGQQEAEVLYDHCRLTREYSTQEEIAASKGMKQSTFKRRLTEARSKLREPQKTEADAS